MYKGRKKDGSYLPVPKKLTQSTAPQIGAAARRFAKDGEIRNAVELLLIAYPDANLMIRPATGSNIVHG